MTTKTVTIHDGFLDAFAMDFRNSCWEKMPNHLESIFTSDGPLFEGAAFELLEIIALGTPDDLPTDATRMSKELSFCLNEQKAPQ